VTVDRGTNAEALVGYLALPETITEWSRTNLRERSREDRRQGRASRCRRDWFEQILRLIDGLRPRPASRGLAGRMRRHHGRSVSEWGKGPNGWIRHRYVGHGGAMGKLCQAAHGFHEPRQNASVPTVPGGI
jgi:hypothetical protein